MAASLCKKHEATPRAIYERYLTELQELMRRGAGQRHASPDYENQGEPDKRKPGKSADVAPE
jgi:hypothetical protein